MLRGNKKTKQQSTNRVITDHGPEAVLTLDVLKAHLRITLNEQEQNEYLTRTLISAREEIESVTGFAFTEQAWKLSMDRWPGETNEWWDGPRVGSLLELYGEQGFLIMPLKYPLREVYKLTVYDYDSNARELDAAAVDAIFDVDTQAWPGRISLKRGATWPIALKAINAIEFEYKCGFYATEGTFDANDIPSWAQRAILTMAAWMYDNRELL